MKKFTALFFLFFIITAFPKNISAQYGCNGNCQINQSISISKMVAKPLNEKGGLQPCDNNINYYDNFSPSDVANRFSPQSYVCFKLDVRNTSNVTLSNVTIQDFVPSYLNPVAGPGTFDSNSRTITFNAGDFAIDDDRNYFFTMQVQSLNQLPVDQGLFCVVNKAEAYNSVVSDNASSQLCIEKQVTNFVSAPSAGPEYGVILLAGESVALGIGIYLKKRIS